MAKLEASHIFQLIRAPTHVIPAAQTQHPFLVAIGRNYGPLRSVVIFGGCMRTSHEWQHQILMLPVGSPSHKEAERSGAGQGSILSSWRDASKVLVLEVRVSYPIGFHHRCLRPRGKSLKQRGPTYRC